MLRLNSMDMLIVLAIMFKSDLIRNKLEHMYTSIKSYFSGDYFALINFLNCKHENATRCLESPTSSWV